MKSSPHPRQLLQYILVICAVGFLGLRAATNSNVFMSQLVASRQPVATAVLPTIITKTGPSTHQITAGEYADEIIGTMNIHDKIAQMIMIKLIGTTFSTDEMQMIEQEHVGSVIAFGDAIHDGQQVKQLTSELQQHAYLPLFIATDQEGGPSVNRLYPLIGSRPGAPDMGKANSTTIAMQDGEQTANDLLTYGFNFNLAPVVDIQEPGIYNPQLGGRLFSSDPNIIANMANAYLEGLQNSDSVVGVIKHFPGLGASATDPHRGLPIVYKSQAELDSDEFVPYRLLFADGNVHVVMVTHEMLPKIDPSLPATLSHAIMTGLLRDDLGYNGLIVTDSLDMEAIAAQYPIEQAALLAAKAGADILMGPSTPDGVQRSIDTITSDVQNGQIAESRINDSVRRILVEKMALGLIKIPNVQVANSPTIPAGSPTPANKNATTTPVAIATKQP